MTASDLLQYKHLNFCHNNCNSLHFKRPHHQTAVSCFFEKFAIVIENGLTQLHREPRFSSQVLLPTLFYFLSSILAVSLSLSLCVSVCLPLPLNTRTHMTAGLPLFLFRCCHLQQATHSLSAPPVRGASHPVNAPHSQPPFRLLQGFLPVRREIHSPSRAVLEEHPERTSLQVAGFHCGFFQTPWLCVLRPLPLLG